MPESTKGACRASATQHAPIRTSVEEGSAKGQGLVFSFQETEVEGLGHPSPERARQFMPFAALRGYRELLRERERQAARAFEPERQPATPSDPSPPSA